MNQNRTFHSLSEFYKSLNVPNRLTLLRIILVPVAVLLYLLIPENTGILEGNSGFGLRNLLVLIVFAVASFTDYLDGQIARKEHMITSFGKFLDPIADKMLVNTLLILLVWSHTAQVLPVLLMIARDLIVDGLRFSAATSGEVVAAGWWGKVKTVLQMVAIILLLLNNWPFVLIHIPMDQIVLWAAALASLYSGWIYFQRLKKYVLESL